MWKRIAHRGASGTRPELTAPAFARAVELGADMVELDVQLTRDAGLVVLHDLELGRTTGGHGAVRDHDLADLCGRDAGSWFGRAYVGATVLSLDDVCDLVPGRVELNVEIKSPEPDWEGTATAVVEILRRRSRLASTIISSFSIGALRSVRRNCEEARLAVLWHVPEFPEVWQTAAELGAVALHPLYKRVDEGLLRRAHDEGLTVNTWTVNDPAEMRRLLDLGVDGLVSDFPERFVEIG
jgi:glycerophosphoryl diester phosphodiesterase